MRNRKSKRERRYSIEGWVTQGEGSFKCQMQQTMVVMQGKQQDMLYFSDSESQLSMKFSFISLFFSYFSAGFQVKLF